jgi:predicted CXXCH cytochrome family protein
MEKRSTLIGLVILGLFVWSGMAAGIDTPHNVANCQDCHMLHSSVGPGLTKDSNANLCITCHSTGATGPTSAAAKPFSDAMQANTTNNIYAMRKTSHAWNGVMPTTDNPGAAFGLRSNASLQADVSVNGALKGSLGKFGTCSVSPSTNTTYSTCTTAGGTWTAQVVCSTCHNVHYQGMGTWDPNAPAYVANGGTGRHFMRAANDLNQLCEACHYYRTPASAPGGTSQTNVRTWDGNKKSHPIMKNTSTDTSSPLQFNAVPLEPAGASWTPQNTGPRYHVNGGTDTNTTNNIVFDANGQMRCLSCHGVHYTDSNTSTVDTP